MRSLGVFVHAPIPGRVKSRLADDVGPSVAAEVYWQIGRRVIAQVTASDYRTTIWFTPAGEATFVREWLEGLGRLELRPQSGGALGDRLGAAFTRHFVDGARGGGGGAVIIGVDCPGIDRRVVADAFHALESHDVVAGPTPGAGGEVYLVGLRAPQPALLRGLRGTGFLHHLTRRAGGQNRSLHLLRPLRPVISAQDARLAGLLESRPTLGEN